MAGDWIKIRCDLHEDPAVIGIAAQTGLDEDAVVGKLVRLWSWANRQLRDGCAPSATFVWVDRHVRCAGFAQAMADAGWLELADGTRGLRIPKFDRHNSQSAKSRALAASRMRDQRNGRYVSSATPAQLEKRRVREESTRNPPTPLEGGEGERGAGAVDVPQPEPCVLTLPLPAGIDTPEVRAAWVAYCRHLLDIHRPLSGVAAPRLLSELGRMGPARAAAALEYTVRANRVSVAEPPAAGKAAPAAPESVAQKIARIRAQEANACSRPNTTSGPTDTPPPSASGTPT